MHSSGMLFLFLVLLFFFGCAGSSLLCTGFLVLCQVVAAPVAACGLVTAVASLVGKHVLQMCGLQ